MLRISFSESRVERWPEHPKEKSSNHSNTLTLITSFSSWVITPLKSVKNHPKAEGGY
jgi:hypothetical protein